MDLYKLGAGVNETPGVYTREVDATLFASSATSTEAAIAGVFTWGPVNEPRLIQDEAALASTFGPPTNDNFETFFSAANFLAYSNRLWVNRVVDSNAVSAVANSTAVNVAATHTVFNTEDYNNKQGSFENGVHFIAKAPGARGSSLKISTVATAEQFSSTINLGTVGGNTLFAHANTGATFTVGSDVATIRLANTAALTGNTPMVYANAVVNALTVGDYLTIGNSSIGTQDVKIRAIGPIQIANTAGTNTGTATIAVTLDQPVKVADEYKNVALLRSWEYASLFNGAPAKTFAVSSIGGANVDGVHVVVVDEDGGFTQRPGAVLEVFENVSRATDAKDFDGEDNYIKNVLNTRSNYIWYGKPTAAAPVGLSNAIASATGTTPVTLSLSGGADGGTESTVSVATIANGYSKFSSTSDYELAAVIVGKTRGGTYGEQILNNIIDNVGEARKDIVVYGSPARDLVVNKTAPLTDMVLFSQAVRYSSYACIDSGYKFQYDRYNDVFRHVPLNGDIAGLSCRTDVEFDPWVSPAGPVRGKILNLVKLSWNPNAAEQKVLFSNDINPVITYRGEGTQLMGDKTHLGQNSSMNSLGIRKMFNLLKTNIARASRSLLFDFNDEYTQARFRNMTEPLLRDVQGRRGIVEYAVKCDNENNTDQVKNNYQFVGDIFIRASRNARTIHLNFVSVNNVADFVESL